MNEMMERAQGVKYVNQLLQFYNQHCEKQIKLGIRFYGCTEASHLTQNGGQELAR